LFTQEAETEAVGDTAAGDVELVDDVLEHPTRSVKRVATAGIQRCIARFLPVSPLTATRRDVATLHRPERIGGVRPQCPFYLGRYRSVRCRTSI
jgi:hypothetical protein